VGTMNEPGRREQHKRRTREVIETSAMALFFERGYDAVTVADVAEHAGVSVATVFNYYDTKEDLFFDEVEPLLERLVDVVTSCPPGRSILAALQDHVVYQLTAGRTGPDLAEVASFHHAISRSHALQRREMEIVILRRERLSRAISEAVGGKDAQLVGEIAAAQYLAAEAILAAHLRKSFAAGRAPRTALRQIQPLIEQVFGTVRSGLGPLAKAEHRPRFQQRTRSGATGE
jgi:AcrR family transcriptional regulator